MARIFWGRSTSCFIYSFVFQVIMKKHCGAKISQGIWERSLYENNRNSNSCKFCCKYIFIPFLFFHRNQKQESNFQQVGGLVTWNSFTFYLQWVALYFKGMPNSIDFHKRIFLLDFLSYSCSYYSSMFSSSGSFGFCQTFDQYLFA